MELQLNLYQQANQELETENIYDQFYHSKRSLKKIRIKKAFEQQFQIEEKSRHGYEYFKQQQIEDLSLELNTDFYIKNIQSNNFQFLRLLVNIYIVEAINYFYKQYISVFIEKMFYLEQIIEQMIFNYRRMD
ncbi:unnamed protein product [Paramecium sonneborni]|uniref:Uncharacterized protein n=1 Tax=Paramecium sonneborni TaxID=65129 RepID=A0A8S1LUS2_9CILI|nr:unnamed protein product [Paramecium sonneborni]